MRIIAQAAIMDDQHYTPAEVSEMEAVYDAAVELGLTDIRFSAPWFLTRYTDDAWDERFCTRVDQHITAIKDRGLGVIPILVGMSTPCWASASVGKDCSNFSGKIAASYSMPTSTSLIESHVTAAVNRWDVDGIEVCNEPNHPNSTKTPAQEVTFHIETRNGVLASTKPDLPIYGGTLSGTIQALVNESEAAYLQEMYDVVGFADSFDYLVVHPYGLDQRSGIPWTQVGPSDYLEEEINELRAVVALEDPGKQLVYNEIGWTTGTFGGAITPISEQQKADWLVEALLWQAAQSDTAMAGFFSLWQPTTPVTQTHFGVLDQRARKTYTYYAVKEAIQQINGH